MGEKGKARRKNRKYSQVGSGLANIRRPKMRSEDGTLRVLGKEVCLSSVLLRFYSLRIMFHKLRFCIDFSLGYKQMVMRKAEVVTKQ